MTQEELELIRQELDELYNSPFCLSFLFRERYNKLCDKIDELEADD